MVFTPDTQGRRDETWAPTPRQRLANSDTFEMSGGSGHMGAPPVDARPRKPSGSIFGGATNNPSAALRNIMMSPVKRPQPSRNRSNMFT
jgi:E3 ubiquitin-protein ligase CCNP1IP1